MQPKRFIAPVWILGILIVMRIGFLTTSIITYLKYVQSYKLEGNFWLIFIISAGVELLLLIGQAITYWVLRKKRGRKIFAWLHMAIYSIIFFMMPTLMILSPFLSDNLFGGSSSLIMQKIGISYRYVFLTFFLGGLAFFIAFIVSTRKNDLAIEAPTGNDILSDI